MKQIVRNLILASAAMAAIAFTANTANAAAQVNVPFSFQVNGKTFPAGQYVVNKTWNQNLVTLQAKDAKAGLMSMIRPGQPAPTDTRIILTFDEKDQSHALRSIQYGSQVTPRLDGGSKWREKATVREIQGQ
jgi:hypothetical protein